MSARITTSGEFVLLSHRGARRFVHYFCVWCYMRLRYWRLLVEPFHYPFKVEKVYIHVIHHPDKKSSNGKLQTILRVEDRNQDITELDRLEKMGSEGGN